MMSYLESTKVRSNIKTHSLYLTISDTSPNSISLVREGERRKRQIMIRVYKELDLSFNDIHMESFKITLWCVDTCFRLKEIINFSFPLLCSSDKLVLLHNRQQDKYENHECNCCPES